MSETSHVERIFGIASPTEKRSHVEETPLVDEEQISAVIKMKYLLAAVGRDPCRNTFPGIDGPKKLKITCEGQVVQGDRFVQQKVANLAALPGTNLPSPPLPEQASALVIPWRHCERNDKLSQCLYGRPARMFPCVRCQVYCRSMHSCRVQKGHSNPDFDLIHNFSGVGGVDGLLRPFLSQERNKASPSTAQASSELVETNGEASAPSTANAQNKDNASSTPATSDPPKTDESASKKSDLQADNQGASEAIEDPTEFLAKSKTALQMANRLLILADSIAKAPTMLDEEFIKSYFPVDPSDGHYIYCIICGLSGDVICCEGCQNVVHTHCIGLPQIPEDDWFCSKCVAKQPHTQSKNPPPKLPHVIGNVDGNAPTQETEAELLKINGDAIGTLTNAIENKLPATEMMSDDSQKERKIAPPETAANQMVQFEVKASTSVSPLLGSSERKAESEIAEEPRKSEKIRKGDAEPPVTGAMNVHQHQKAESRRPAPISDSQFEKEATELAQYLEELQTERTKNDPPPVIPETSKTESAERNSASVSGSKADKASGESKRKENDPAVESVQPEDEPTRIPIGTKFTKDFDGDGVFQGEVVSLPTDSRLYYGVRYEDGDSEDLYELELLDLLPLSESKKYVKTPVKKKQRYWSRVKKVPGEARAESEAPPKKKQRYWSRVKKVPGEALAKSEGPPKKKQRYWSRVKKVPSEAPAEARSRQKKTPTPAQPEPEPESSNEATREEERKRRTSFVASDDSNNSDVNDQIPGRRRSRRPPNRFSDQALKLYSPRKRATSTPGGARSSPRKPPPEEADDAPAAVVPRGRGRPRKSLVEDVEVVKVQSVAIPREQSPLRASRRRGRSVIVDQEEEKQESGMDMLDKVHKSGEAEGSPEHLKLGRARRAKRHFDDV